jgi:2-polyprenyl-6-methoxyphenol hydroxylase-like FAD-dependent oxidoreductase
MEIAIVGAGISGLASAILLAPLGHRITLYERFATTRPIGSGLMLQPTGLAALERLGLRRELATLGQRIDRLHGVTARGTTVFDLAYGALSPDLHAVAVHRAALHGVLWRGFERSGARLETGCTIGGVAARSGGRASLVDDAGRVLAAADLIIDASGARSPIRGWVCRRQPRLFPYGAVWASVPDIGIAPNTLAQRYVAARTMIGYLPVGRITAAGDRIAALFWSLKPPDYAAWRDGFAAWQDQICGLWPELSRVVQALDGPDALTLAGYTHFTADRLSRDNVVLVGDAAHATSPQLGQGANHGLIDAVVLADALCHAGDIASATALYQRERWRHVQFYQYASALMTPFFQSDSVILAKLRDLTFDRTKIVPYLHREMLRTLAGLKTGVFRSRLPDKIVNCICSAQVTREVLPVPT